MSQRVNNYGQPVGPSVSDWTTRPRPERKTFTGRYCRLEPLEIKHADELFDALSQAPDGRDWTYLFAEPFQDRASYRSYVGEISGGSDPIHYAIIDLTTELPVGSLALMRITPEHGVVEVGHVTYSPLLKRTRIATEAQYLLMRYALEELRYRRYEWKCDSLNAPSRAAALRLGFTFEGIFRKAIVYKGRSRDTAWFSIIDDEWPAVRHALESWLAPDNFDDNGRQRQKLSELTASVRVQQ